MAQSNPDVPLIGSVFERKPGSSSSFRPRASDSTRTGFPSVKHRSQSAFARARNVEQSGGQDRPQQPPRVTALPPRRPVGEEPLADDWRHQAEEENTRKVESMSPEELEQEQKEILERFGPNIADVLKKARAAREKKNKAEDRASRNPAEIITEALNSPESSKIYVPSPSSTPRKSASKSSSNSLHSLITL